MPSASVPSSQDRIEFRVPTALKELVERAAGLQGRTVSDFAKEALARTAEQVIRAHNEVVLSDRDRAEFLRILSADPAPNAALLKAAKRYRKSVAGAG